MVPKIKRPAVFFGNVARDREADSGAAGIARARILKPEKRREYGLQLIFGDARTTVANVYDHMLSPEANSDLRVCAILYRIVD